MVYSRAMKSWFRSTLLCALATALGAATVAPSIARANSEPPSVHGARHTGMGGLGAAFVEGPPSIFHNPAGLLSIDKFELTLGFTNLIVTYNAPFGGYGSEQDSPPLFGPLPFLGAGFRVGDNFALGLAAYISVGFGGRFEDITLFTEGARVADDGSRLPSADPFVSSEPINQTVQLFIAEVAVPFAWEPIEGLRLAAALRLPYGNFRAIAFQDIVGSWAPADQRVSGVGLPAGFVGFQYDISETVTIGAAYRTIAKVPMSGTVVLENGLGGIGDGSRVVLDADTEWVVPHMVRAGIAFRLLEQRLLLSAEGRVQLHRSANKELRFDLSNTRDVADGGVPDALWNLVERIELNQFTSNFQWKNVFTFGVAAELALTDHFWWRFATTLGNNATPGSTTTPFSPPPSRRSWQVATGFGAEIGHFVLDMGFAAGLVPPANVQEDDLENCNESAIVKGGCSGVYSLTSWFIGLSGTYRM